jgi:hypothetical protein
MMTRSIAIVLLMLWGWPVSAHAQGGSDAPVARSFEQLQVLVRPGNTITVMDAAGAQVSGRLETLSSSLLSLSVDGTRRDFSEMDVDAIRRRGDSLANGAWWGFGVGMGIAALAIATCVECFTDEPAWIGAAVVMYGALGTGFGVGIDALVRGQHTIYRRPGLNVSLRF